MKSTKQIATWIGVLALATNLAKSELLITASAANSVSVALVNGDTLLGSNSRVELGYFSSAVNRALFETYTTASSFTTGWTSIAQGVSSWEYAPGAFADGLFSVNTALSTGDNSLLNRQLFVLIGNASSIASSSEIAVVTNSAWVVPTNPTGDVPDVFTFDFLDVTSQQAGIMFGSYSAGGGAYPDDGVVDAVKLQTVVPEPSTGALMMIGAVGLVALRRLRKV